MTRRPTPSSATAWIPAPHFWAPAAAFSTRQSICGEAPFEGFHYCGYGLDEHFASMLQDAGVVISAHAPDAGPEALELAEHPFFLATAFQPQVGSSQSGELHPVLSAWLQAAAGRPPRPGGPRVTGSRRSVRRSI
jgi:hypothetical protein